MAALQLRAFSPELDGTMMPYDFEGVDTVVPWGDDMQPIFISYIARHGARYLSSEKKITGLETELHNRQLTASGDSLLLLINRIREATGSGWGALSPVGIAEEQRLGRELYAIAPKLFAHGKVKAEATYVPRVVMSMYEVCHELNRLSPSLEISTEEGPQLDSLLRFFTTDREYAAYLRDGRWKATYDSIFAELVPAAPAARLMKKPSGNLKKITMEMYGILQSLRASGVDGNPACFFTEEEYRRCWEVDNLLHYYQRSANPFSELPAESAVGLLRRIEAATLAEPGVVARCYFGHAETIMPLLAAMHLPGCYEPDDPAKWQDYEVSPLGANLVIVTLRAPDGSLHTAMRLNGRWLPER